MEMFQATGNAHFNEPPTIPLNIETRQVWMRPCPSCKATIEKQQAADSWKCQHCGWE